MNGTVSIRKSANTRKQLVEDGTEKYVSYEIALVLPSADVLIADRLYIDSTMYDVKSVEDVDGMGREKYLTLDRMPDGTAGAMGV